MATNSPKKPAPPPRVISNLPVEMRPAKIATPPPNTVTPPKETKMVMPWIARMGIAPDIPGTYEATLPFRKSRTSRRKLWTAKPLAMIRDPPTNARKPANLVDLAVRSRVRADNRSTLEMSSLQTMVGSLLLSVGRGAEERILSTANDTIANRAIPAAI